MRDPYIEYVRIPSLLFLALRRRLPLAGLASRLQEDGFLLPQFPICTILDRLLDSRFRFAFKPHHFHGYTFIFTANSLNTFRGKSKYKFLSNHTASDARPYYVCGTLISGQPNVIFRSFSFNTSRKRFSIIFSAILSCRMTSYH